MPTSYNGKNITPSPFMSISKEFTKSGNGETVGSQWVITLSGKLVAEKGSPIFEGSSNASWHTTSGYPADTDLDDDEHLKSILKKQRALRELFSEDGKTLEVSPWDGTTPLKCNPRVRSINFQEGPWYWISDYQVILECDSLYGLGVEAGNPYYLTQADEDWSLDSSDEIKKVYRLTHRVSASSRGHYDETGTLTAEAYENALAWVTSRLGIDPDHLNPDAMDTNLRAYDYSRVQSTNVKAGSVSITESWTCIESDTPSILDETIEVRTDVKDGRSVVSVQGQIKGLEVRNNSTYALSTGRWSNAQARWITEQALLHGRAQTISGLTLRTTIDGKTIGYNQEAGTINYNLEYSDKPDNELDEDALDESFSITDEYAVQVVAQISTLGRMAGPIFQDIGSRTANRRSIEIQIQKPAKKQGATPTKPSVDGFILNAYPVGWTQIFVAQNQESWDPIQGRYTRSVVLVWI